MGMEIIDSARKHGVADEDMLHAVRFAPVTVEIDGLLMYVGPARSGAFLEVGQSTSTGRIIHAMPARDKFLALI